MNKIVYYEVCLALASWCLFFSCSSSKEDLYLLKPSADSLVFPLDQQTTVFIKALFPYTDEHGKEFLTFQNNIEPELLVYDMETQQYIKTITLDKEGAVWRGFSKCKHLYFK